MAALVLLGFRATRSGHIMYKDTGLLACFPISISQWHMRSDLVLITAGESIKETWSYAQSPLMCQNFLSIFDVQSSERCDSSSIK